MLKELKRLQEAGTVIKEAMKADRGAGTCYKRTVLVPMNRYARFDISTIKAVSDLKAVMEDVVERNPNKNEAEIWAGSSFYHAYATICQVILNELERSLGSPEPDKNFNSTLNDFIVPLIKELVPYFQHPAINNERAKSAFFKAIMLGDKKIWNILKSDNHQNDEDIEKGGDKD